MGGLKTKVARGFAWSGLEQAASYAIHFVLGIIMARLLAPGDYGIIGMFGIFLALSRLFVDCGFGAALVQKKDRDEVDYATVFFYNLGMAIVCYAGLYVAAPHIADFYNMPILTNVCRVVSLTLPLNALMTVHRLRMSIMLDFGHQSLISLLAMITSGIFGIVLAYNGCGVWSIVWQSIFSTILTIILFWSFSHWHPIFAFSIKTFKRFFNFGWKDMASNILDIIYLNIYTIVIGKAFGATDLGYFARADDYARMPSLTVKDVLVKIIYPVLTRVQDDRQALISVYTRILRPPIFILAPILFGLAAVGYPIVEVVLGTKWLPCVPFLQILCAGAVFLPLSTVNTRLLFVKGRMDCVLKLTAFTRVISFVLILAMIPLGIFWMCVGKAFLYLLSFAVNCYYTKKILDFGFVDQFKMLLPILINAAIMFVIVQFAMMPFAGAWGKLVVGTLVGAVSFVSFAILVRDPSVKELMAAISALRK